MPSRVVTTWLLALAAGVAACGGGDSTTEQEAVPDAPDMITVSSSAFQDGQPVPARFTCDGDGDAPPLTWDDVPADSSVLALVVDDPDAPNGTFVHWIVLDIPVETSGIATGEVPSGAAQAKNSAGKASYVGPCPPSGTHHYRLTVYALSRRTGLSDGVDMRKALAAIEAAATTQGQLIGTYARSG